MKRDRFDVLARNMKFPMPSLEQNVAILLRKEHEAVVKMVRQLRDENQQFRARDRAYPLMVQGWDSRVSQCTDILAALARRAK